MPPTIGKLRIALSRDVGHICVVLTKFGLKAKKLPKFYHPQKILKFRKILVVLNIEPLLHLVRECV